MDVNEINGFLYRSMKWWQILLIIIVIVYLAGIIYQLFFEDKKAHRVNVMRRRMFIADKNSLVRRMNAADDIYYE
jgi:cytochrome c oxidase assembly factor CtaG